MTMRTRLVLTSLFALVAVLAATTTAPAQGPVPTPTAYNKYTLSGTSTVGTVRAGFRAYALLPKSLPDRTANGGPVLRFGPIGSCRFNLSISAKVVARGPAETAQERTVRLRPASRQYVYAEGTRASAAWRVIRVKGTANVQGIYIAPGSVRTGPQFDSPSIPAWIEVRATANDHVSECHSGGPRYIGDSLAEAFGAMTSTAFRFPS